MLERYRGMYLVALLAALSTFLSVGSARAQTKEDKDKLRTYNVQTYIDWMNKYKDTKPDFKPGDVLTAKDLERMRPFVPPGWLEQFNFAEFKAPIIAPLSHVPRKDYMDCTEKYGHQTRIAADGAMENYTCGQPFPTESLDPNDPMSGVKIAWNYEWKWQNFGLVVMNHMWGWVRNGGDHNGNAPQAADPPPKSWTEGIQFNTPFPTNIGADWGGGGTYERTLSGFYQKTLFSHLAQLEGKPLPISNAADFQHKEITIFFEPFDIRGTAFIVYRYIDPHRSDDGWAYVPTLRRVRRISAEVKSDSLLGTDLTIEDYYGFNGRDLDWNWKFLGWKDVLGIYDPGYDFSHTYGTNGTVPNDPQWSVKKVAMVLRTPKWGRHPYSAVINFLEPETWLGPYHVVFDRKDKLWKVCEWTWKYSENFKQFAEINHGIQSYTWEGLSMVDVQNDRATIIRGYGTGFPNYPMTEVQAVYDINHLEQVHR